jgi:hypothetical protein
MLPLKIIKNDDVFIRYQDIVATIDKRIDTSKITNEAKLLHAERKSRTLKGTRPTNDQLYEAVARDLAVRSRLTELKLNLTVESDNLATAQTTIAAHLRVSYAEFMTEYKTQEDKKVLLRRVLRKGTELLERINSVSDQLDLLIKDIDQASFSLSHLVSLFKILHERRDPAG